MDFKSAAGQAYQQPTGPSVPDHILDMIPIRAQAYIDTSSDRLLVGTPEDQHAAILAGSTHHIAGTAERRELHRKILGALTSHLSVEMPERSTLLYVAAPMAAGKTTLLQRFDTRLASGEQATAFEDAALEQAFQVYKSVSARRVASDFQFYKSQLPEFAASGNNYAVIRAEASALDQALIAWSKELHADIVLEQLGDGVEEWLKQQAQDHTLVCIGVTAHPQINARRLEQRELATGQHISQTELIKAVQAFSRDDAFPAMIRHAHSTLLLSHDSDDYKVIVHAEAGEVKYVADGAYESFLEYADMPAAEIAGLMSKPVTHAAAPSPPAA